MPHTVIEEDKNQGKDVRKKRCNLGLTIKPLSPDVSKWFTAGFKNCKCIQSTHSINPGHT